MIIPALTDSYYEQMNIVYCMPSNNEETEDSKAMDVGATAKVEATEGNNEETEDSMLSSCLNSTTAFDSPPSTRKV